MNLTLKRQHVLSEIVAVLEDDGVVLVKLVGQFVGILPHEPERLLGRVHRFALSNVKLAQQNGVLQRRVKELQTLHVVFLFYRIEHELHPLFTRGSLKTLLKRVSEFRQLVQRLRLLDELFQIGTQSSAEGLKQSAETYEDLE